MTHAAPERELTCDGTRERRSALNRLVSTEQIEVTGVVQGVGFRPFVHRLANELGIDGTVGNDSTRVVIVASAPQSVLDEFVDRIGSDMPRLAKVETIHRSGLDGPAEPGFVITPSRVVTGHPTLVPPDTAMCDDCRRELENPNDRRFSHPFITCTNCGPRFTIIEALPYDRPNTTMADFEMCAACFDEYKNPTDRRFHAQPIACHDCGPTLRFLRLSSNDVDGSFETSHQPDPIGQAVGVLQKGATVAIKGVGGYHLACSALDTAAIRRLRDRKRRPDKPLAVMVGDLSDARLLADVDDREADLLLSPARPIVLVQARKDSTLSDLVAPGNPMVGVMLPSTPVHHLLLSRFGGPVVMTSANHSGEPIAYLSDTDLSDLVDAVLDHDRAIHVPCDDSVMRVVADRPTPIRRARGYAPLPTRLGSSEQHVLAVGAELKNTFCVGSGSHSWVSPHLGDMEDLRTLEAFTTMVDRFCRLYQIDPGVVMADAHPGYLSSRWARDRYGDRVVTVQHHHAHLASLMAEHQLDPHAPMFGFVFDGTGYGSDGTIWGGEVLSADADGFQRCAHLAPVALPGGDAATRRPALVALAHLDAAGLSWDKGIPSVRSLDDHELAIVRAQLDTGLGCVPTSSMGRLFDAVASIIGLRHRISFEAQAAIELEIAATRSWERAGIDGGYRFGIDGSQIEAAPVLASLVDDVTAGTDAGVMAWRFHDAVAEMTTRLALEQRDPRTDARVGLTGGVFQNRLLTELCIERLSNAGFDPLTHRVVPPNDGGLSLGQAFIGANATLLAGRA